MNSAKLLVGKIVTVGRKGISFKNEKTDMIEQSEYRIFEKSGSLDHEDFREKASSVSQSLFRVHGIGKQYYFTVKFYEKTREELCWEGKPLIRLELSFHKLSLLELGRRILNL